MAKTITGGSRENYSTNWYDNKKMDGFDWLRDNHKKYSDLHSKESQKEAVFGTYKGLVGVREYVSKVDKAGREERYVKIPFITVYSYGGIEIIKCFVAGIIADENSGYNYSYYVGDFIVKIRDANIIVFKAEELNKQTIVERLKVNIVIIINRFYEWRNKRNKRR